MIVTSFYTPEYAGEVSSWRDSCEQWGLMHCAIAVESRGSWRLNCGHKPQFLLDQMRIHQQPLLWVDIDGRFRRAPDLLMSQSFIEANDFALWFIPNGKMQPQHVPGGPHTGHDGTASGTMWVNYTPVAHRFLEIWAGEERGQGPWEQQVLGEVWHYHRPQELRTCRLPQPYCKVFDAPWFEKQHGPVIIEHMQASRRLRAKVQRRPRR